MFLLALALCHLHEKDMLCPWSQEEEKRHLAHSEVTPVVHVRPFQITDGQLCPRKVSKFSQDQLSLAQISSMLQTPELNICLLLYANTHQ